MTISIRILSALPVAVVATAALVFNLGAFAGGTMILSIVDPSRLTFAYWYSGTGCFLTTTIVMVWLQRPRRADNDSLRTRLSAMWVTQAIAAALLAIVAWNIPGALYVKSGVLLRGVSSEQETIEEAIKTAAASRERSYALHPQLGKDTLLVVRENCADAVIAELQAAGLTVKEPPPPYED